MGEGAKLSRASVEERDRLREEDRAWARLHTIRHAEWTGLAVPPKVAPLHGAGGAMMPDDCLAVRVGKDAYRAVPDGQGGIKMEKLPADAPELDVLYKSGLVRRLLPVATTSPTCPVLLAGEGKPAMVCGVAVPPLTGAAFRAVAALVAAYPRKLARTELNMLASSRDARKALDDLARRVPAWLLVLRKDAGSSHRESAHYLAHPAHSAPQEAPGNPQEAPRSRQPEHAQR